MLIQLPENCFAASLSGEARLFWQPAVVAGSRKYTPSVRSSPSSPGNDFGVLLHRWRSVRRVSQLDLSLDAEISTRHLSCVETGRAQPSREMVLRLAEALQVPLRERNTLLLAAGYAPLYRHTGLDAPELAAARHAMELLMAQLEPNPVLVLDRHWNTVRMNAGARRFLGLFPGCGSAPPSNDTAAVDSRHRAGNQRTGDQGFAGPRGQPHNGVRLVFQPHGLRPFIENWDVIAAQIIRRVHREAVANPSDETMKHFLEELLSYPDVPSRWRMLDLDTPSAFLTLNYRWKSSSFRFFSTLTTLGTPLDVGLQELRIETFFPADEETRAALNGLAEDAPRGGRRR